MQVTEKRLRKAHIIDDVIDGVSLDKSLSLSFVIDYGSSSVDCGDLFPKSQARSSFLCIRSCIYVIGSRLGHFDGCRDLFRVSVEHWHVSLLIGLHTKAFDPAPRAVCKFSRRLASVDFANPGMLSTYDNMHSASFW